MILYTHHSAYGIYRIQYVDTFSIIYVDANLVEKQGILLSDWDESEIGKEIIATIISHELAYRHPTAWDLLEDPAQYSVDLWFHRHKRNKFGIYFFRGFFESFVKNDKLIARAIVRHFASTTVVVPDDNVARRALRYSTQRSNFTLALMSCDKCYAICTLYDYTENDFVDLPLMWVTLDGEADICEQCFVLMSD